MTILVTGSAGQVAQALRERSAERPDLEFYFSSREDIDLAHRGSATRFIQALRPKAVINAAAYTAVDKAEAEPDLAFAINAEGAGEVAEAAAAIGAPAIHISTDYVFDGSASRPYRETDPTGPINVYGRSKLAGETAVRAANPAHVIVRTSWVYSPFGANFAKTMLRLAGERDEIRVVADQYGCPTSAHDLADGLIALLQRPAGEGATIHIAGCGMCSWADFAEEIFRNSGNVGGPTARVIPIATEDYPTPAPRPRYSALDTTQAAARFGIALPDWRRSLTPVVRRLLQG